MTAAAKIRALSASSTDTAWIAKRVGVSRNYVWDVLWRARNPDRARAAEHRYRDKYRDRIRSGQRSHYVAAEQPKPWTPGEVTRLRQMYDAGKSYRDIAAALNRNRNQVAGKIKRECAKK